MFGSVTCPRAPFGPSPFPFELPESRVRRPQSAEQRSLSLFLFFLLERCVLDRLIEHPRCTATGARRVRRAHQSR
jgi:hypothetical protein